MTLALYLSGFSAVLIGIVIYLVSKVTKLSVKVEDLKSSQELTKEIENEKERIKKLSDDELWDSLPNHANSLPISRK
jgi:hypothetical protein